MYTYLIHGVLLSIIALRTFPIMENRARLQSNICGTNGQNMYNSWVETEDWSRQDWAKMEGHRFC
jgi:hypothetical protein